MPGDRTRVVVSGATGRMGRSLAEAARFDAAIEIVGGIAPEDHAGHDTVYPELATPEHAESLIRSADVVIDFSAPPFLRQILESGAAALPGRALVVGTTGLGSAEEDLLKQAATGSAVLVAANFSVGVNVLLSLVEQAARALGPEYDLEVVEAHHRRKEDAPSGTALALGRAAAAGRDVDLERVRRDGRSGRPGARPAGEFGFHAIRGGSIVGEHEVLFIGEGERIELNHRAADRSIFAVGALRAARWLRGRAAGSYSMGDVLGLT